MIREFVSEDLTPVMDIWLACNRQAHSFLPAAIWTARRARIAQSILRHMVFVAEEERALCGFVVFHRGWVRGLFVRPDKQGKGVGRALLDYCKRLSPSLQLQVYAQNTAALAFYRREGFSVTGRSLAPDEDAPLLRLSWSVPSAQPGNAEGVFRQK